MLASIEHDLKQSFDHRLVDELIAAHQEAKRNFYLGGLRLSAVEGGRFCEAAFRMLEQATTSIFTPLGTHLNSEAIIVAVAKVPQAKGSRLDSHPHPPRAARGLRHPKQA